MYRLHLGLRMRSDLNTISTLQGIVNFYVQRLTLASSFFLFFIFWFFIFCLMGICFQLHPVQSKHLGCQSQPTLFLLQAKQSIHLRFHFSAYMSSITFTFVDLSMLRFLSQWLLLCLAKGEQLHVVSLFFICLDLGFFIPCLFLIKLLVCLFLIEEL